MAVETQLDLVRYAKTLVRARGSIPDARSFAEAQYGQFSNIAKMLQQRMAGVVSGTDAITGDGPFANASRYFLGALQRRSLIGRIDAVSRFRHVPPHVQLLEQTSVASVWWTEEGQPIRVNDAQTFDTASLRPLRLSTVTINTRELLAALAPESDAIAQRDLLAATALEESRSFADPESAGIDNVRPASVTYGIAPVVSSGSDAAAVASDVAQLFDGFGGSLESGVFAANPVTAARLALLGGSVAAWSTGAHGGEWLGVAFVVSEGVRPGDLLLLDPSSVWLTDSGVEVDSSEQAVVEVDDGADGTSLINLWERNLAGLRLRRYIAWRVGRPDAVRLLTGLFVSSGGDSETAATRARARRGAAA
ncbi:phage major capsid protein [Paraburkholderia sp. BR13439]|uniref:phage major capsid protein n=1 Tax=Paraburkholderia sp. BR13439 TaxID=3236996 RepID=UPI0034CD82F4